MFWVGVVGLVFFIGLGVLVNVSWLLWGLRKLGSYCFELGWMGFVLCVGLVCLVMGLL